jgi:hypothetical protein
MEKMLIIGVLVLVFIFSFSYLVFSQIPGEFTIGNSDPTVTGYEVQEADGSWDSVDFTTHVSDTALRWTVNDENNDPLATTLCIGTSASPYASVDCNVVNYNGFASASNGEVQTYNYNTDPTGVLQGVPDTVNFAGSDCSSDPCTKTYYVDIIVDDGQGGSVVSSSTFELTDSLPVFFNVYLSDTSLTVPDDSCEDYLPVQSCLINPTQGDYTSISARLTVTDTDDDCSDLTHTAQVILCMVDAAGPELCDLLNNVDYTYDLSFSSITGSDCDFDISIPIGDTQGIEFFKSPGVYKMYIEATSQAGTGTSGFPAAPQWEYGSIPAPLFPSQVFLGDRVVDGGDGIQLGSWNPGLSSETIINQGNVVLSLDWEATDPSTDLSTCDGHTSTCWDLTTADDLQIDDDSDQADDTGNLVVADVPEGPATVQFQPTGGLQLCDVMTCDSGISETFDINFHIMPPTGLSAGTYETDFTVTIGII